MTQTVPVAALPHKILLDRVSKRFGTFVALDGVTLGVRPGEFLTLLGPSGSGKTTVLNMISGAILPSEGRLLIDGSDVTDKPARERGLGMVFQNYALLPHMSVFDNVAFPLRVRGWSKARIQEAVRNVLDRVSLTAFADRKPRQLSGGQQQRVGIARCLVYSPEIILMDEPLGALDRNLRDQMQEEIKSLHRELSTTIVYVTHDQEEALNLSDRICLMRQGRIEQLGTPEEMYFEPDSAFAAEFIGDSNLFAGALVNETTFRTVSGQTIRIASARGVAPGHATHLLVRPEKISDRCEDGQAVNRIEGVVESVSFVGGLTRVSVRTRHGAPLVFKNVSTRADGRAQAGMPVSLGWEPSDSIVLAS